MKELVARDCFFFGRRLECVAEETGRLMAQRSKKMTLRRKQGKRVEVKPTMNKKGKAE